MLEIGDKVKIRDDLEVGNFGELYCNHDMVNYAGLTATIIGGDHLYEIDLDEGVWAWNEDMFEPEEIVSKDEFEKFMRS